LKAERNDESVKDALAALDRGARGEENLMPLILEAVRSYSTLGEICDVLRGVFGEYQAINTLG
jgi:methylmalonyl-CoA mutase N-terminal domain/subunit